MVHSETTRTFIVAATSAALLAYICARVRRAGRDIISTLKAAEASAPYTHSSPIYYALLHKEVVKTACMTLQYVLPESSPLESLQMRLIQKDVAKGCIDPDLFGTELCRDVLFVKLQMDGTEAELRIPAFMAHLVNPFGLCDPEASDPASSLWADGSWSGTLLWDSAVHVCDLLLSSAIWRQRMRGASCLELGCGLGVPGLVAGLLGAAPVLLSDRAEVALLAEAGCRAAGLPCAHGIEFDWEESAAHNLIAERFDGQPPSIILACDCIFAPLFGGSHLLLRMLAVLAGPASTILIALERRPEDDAERFFALAAETGFEVRLLTRVARVVVCEMWRRGGRGAVR